MSMRESRRDRRRRGYVSKALKLQIFERDGHRCRWCGRPETPIGEITSTPPVSLTIDHIFPVSRGGTSDPDNLQTLCNRCNSAKGNTVYYLRAGKKAVL